MKPSCLSRFCKRILCYKRKISEARRATNIVVLPRQQSRHGGGNLSFQCILACDIKVVRVFGLICCLCVVFFRRLVSSCASAGFCLDRLDCFRAVGSDIVLRAVQFVIDRSSIPQACLAEGM